MLLVRKWMLKIADVGVAEVRGDGANGHAGLHGAGGAAKEAYNHKCDVYSCSILLWEAYCCSMTYPNYSLTDISYHVVNLVCLPCTHACITCLLGRHRHHCALISARCV